MAALLQIMAWRRTGDKPLSEPMLVCCTGAYKYHSASVIKHGSTLKPCLSFSFESLESKPVASVNGTKGGAVFWDCDHCYAGSLVMHIGNLYILCV